MVCSDCSRSWAPSSGDFSGSLKQRACDSCVRENVHPQVVSKTSPKGPKKHAVLKDAFQSQEQEVGTKLQQGGIEEGEVYPSTKKRTTNCGCCGKTFSFWRAKMRRKLGKHKCQVCAVVHRVVVVERTTAWKCSIMPYHLHLLSNHTMHHLYMYYGLAKICSTGCCCVGYASMSPYSRY